GRAPTCSPLPRPISLWSCKWAARSLATRSNSAHGGVGSHIREVALRSVSVPRSPGLTSASTRSGDVVRVVVPVEYQNLLQTAEKGRRVQLLGRPRRTREMHVGPLLFRLAVPRLMIPRSVVRFHAPLASLTDLRVIRTRRAGA